MKEGREKREERRKKNFLLPSSFFHLLSSSRGITLIEVLIASVIMSTGLLLIIEGMGRSQTAIRTAENMVLSSQLAEEQLAQTDIQARQFAKISSSSESGTVKIPGREFQWQKRIEPFHHKSIKDETKLNRVSVELTWKEGGRSDGGFALESLILNREKVSK